MHIELTLNDSENKKPIENVKSEVAVFNDRQ